jgi:hypothetical protein
VYIESVCFSDVTVWFTRELIFESPWQHALTTRRSRLSRLLLAFGCDAGSGAAVEVQLIPPYEMISNYDRNLPFDGSKVAAFAVTLPPFGSSEYAITGKTAASALVGSTSASEPSAPVAKAAADVVIENNVTRLVFSRTTGRLSEWTNKETGSTISAHQYFCYYEGSTGGNHSVQPSGAYIFR